MNRTLISFFHLVPKRIIMLEYARIGSLPGYHFKKIINSLYNLEEHFLIYYLILKPSNTKKDAVM